MAIQKDKIQHFVVMFVCTIVLACIIHVLFVVVLPLGLLTVLHLTRKTSWISNVLASSACGVVVSCLKEWYDCGTWTFYPWGPVVIAGFEVPFIGPKGIATGWGWLDLCYDLMAIGIVLAGFVFIAKAKDLEA